jgi:hypothetical protein
VAIDGRLAFVRRGQVYVKRPGARARRLARGGDPSWSPHARRIAFVRHDAIYRANPDAAYFGRDVTRLFVLDLRTRRVRRVTSEVMAVQDEPPPNGLDWQAMR